MKSPRLLLTMAIAASVILALAPNSSAQAPPQLSPLATKIGELTKDNKRDEVIALVRARAAEPMPAAEVPLLMFRVAQWLYVREEYEPSLALLKEITEKFPQAPASSLAWCGMGQVYGRLGKNDEMIAALERGINARRAWTQMDIMDAGDTHGYACGVLGEHYVKTGQWEKALAVFSGWEPRSWCGTCLQSMEFSKAGNQILCEAHLGRFESAIERAWRRLGRDGIGGFVLVRLYAESDQLDDLQTMALDYLEQKYKRYPRTDDLSDRYYLTEAVQTVASLSSAIADARRIPFDEHANVLRARDERAAVSKHVARWWCFREKNRAVPELENEFKDDDANGHPFLEILAALDSPASGESLVRLAIEGDVYRQQYICGLMRHRMTNPQPLIAKVVEGVPEERARNTNWNVDRTPTHYRFYQHWTPPQKKSLPTKLAASLFAEQDSP